MKRKKGSLKKQYDDVRKLIKTDSMTKESEAKRADMVRKFCVVVFVISFIMTVLNIIMKSWLMGITTSGLMVVYGLSWLFIGKVENPKPFYVMTLMTATIVFGIYYVIGGNDGFAALWILLIPMVSVSGMGINMALPVMGFSLLFLIVISYTPLKELVPYDYSEDFVNRFPILYLAVMLFMTRFGLREKALELEKLGRYGTLMEAVEQERKKNVENSVKTITTIVNAMEARDPYTRNHSRRVAFYSKEIGKKIGFDSEKLNRLYLAGLVHDIGKINMPDRILNKSDKLTDDEWMMVKLHPETGFKIVREYDNVVKGIGDATRFHHERIDGTGYPYGLKGDKIPEFAKIVAVADAFDAMSSKRMFKDRENLDYAISQIKEGAGTQFDAEIAELFSAMVENGDVTVQED